MKNPTKIKFTGFRFVYIAGLSKYWTKMQYPGRKGLSVPAFLCGGWFQNMYFEV